MSNKYDIIIEIGIIGLLVYMTLAFGGVLDGSIALMEIVTALLLLVWLTKLVSQRHSASHAFTVQHGKCQVRIATSPLLLILVVFTGLILFQLLPLPAFFVRIVSPETYHVYAEAATNTALPLPAFLPISVCSYATAMELRKLLAYLMIFVLTVNTIRSPRQITRLIYVIIALGLFESLYGILEYFSGHQHIFFHKKTSSLAVSGTFVNKNHFAGYLEMVIPLAFSLLFTRLTEHSQTSSKKLVRFLDEKYMKILLTCFLLAIMIAALILSSSRGGMLSFASGMGCLMGLAYNRRLLRKGVIVVLILVVFAGGLSVFMGYDLIMTRLHTLVQLDTELSFQLRWNIWHDTLSIVRDFPIFGTGLGAFSHIFPRYQTFPSHLAVLYAESDYLQTLAETGAVGMILILCGGIVFFSRTLKAWKQRYSRWSIVIAASGMSAVFAILIHACIDFNLHIPANALLFSVIAAVTSTAAHSQRRSPR
ncbi:hypothetical protein CSA56_04745 [candidate division KSB3 bacterium]|uniref:O-antigen ligase-related domain-containing protein n=1 Tax=candidate division KSB3 bacterium TaxID=2044937 RepID=A0A2G6KJS9_9BACT|nr:MAG: hypothetical protein CSA56_04745 [candidate division KSB3 bacterium]